MSDLPELKSEKAVQFIANIAADFFRKGFESGKSAGIEEAEERIIKLLEADCKDGIGDNLQGCFHEVAINLIKGEQK